MQTFTEISSKSLYVFFYQKNTNGEDDFFLHKQNEALNLVSVDTSNTKFNKKDESTPQIKSVSIGLALLCDIHIKTILKNAIINSPNQSIQLTKIRLLIYL